MKGNDAYRKNCKTAVSHETAGCMRVAFSMNWLICVQGWNVEIQKEMCHLTHFKNFIKLNCPQLILEKKFVSLLWFFITLNVYETKKFI